MSASHTAPLGRVVVTHPLHEDIRQRLGESCIVDMNPYPEPWPAATTRNKLTQADAVIAFMTDRIGRDVVQSARRLKIVAGAFKGEDNVDVPACSERGIWVSVVPDLLTAPTAELAIGLTIGLGRNVLSGDRLVRSATFNGWRPHLYGIGLQGSVVGLLGLGAIGRAVAARLRGFDANVTYFDRRRADTDEEAALDIEAVSLDHLLAHSDFIIVCLPLTRDTKHMIDSTALAAMKPGALLVNPSRGSVVAEEHVVEALRGGHLGGYAADAFEMEDLARDDCPHSVPQGLRDLAGRTLFTPHLGSAVREARKAIEHEAVSSVLDALQGRCPRGAVNSVSNGSGFEPLQWADG